VASAKPLSRTLSKSRLPLSDAIRYSMKGAPSNSGSLAKMAAMRWIIFQAR
jgi:hypothetical protein